MSRTARFAAIVLALAASSRTASAAPTEVLFDVDDPASTLFPSDLFTVLDLGQSTSRRVDLPKPDCASQPLACEDIDVLNTFDGFSVQPRLSIPFSGPIDVASVTSDTVFLISLGSTLGGGPLFDRVGINQVVWDPATNTLHAQSDELLRPHTRYALIVTSGVRDAAGAPIAGATFDWFRADRAFARQLGERVRTLHAGVLAAVDHARRHTPRRVVAATVFTTHSTTTALEQIRRQLDAARVAPASFTIGSNGERAVFPVGAVSSIVFNRQVTTAPGFAVSSLPVGVLQTVPGAVGALAFGKLSSPSYLAPGEVIPRVPTRTGRPAVQGSNEIFFDLFLPSGAQPARGWPVAIFGHGFGSNKEAAPFVLAPKLAEHGIAVISINVPGHSGGPLGTLQVTTAAGTVTFPAGGRGIDQNGDGRIDGTEGSAAARPHALIGASDALRQTVVDLMQLVRTIRVGMDVDGDGRRDLDPSRIYYFGQSFGGIYGTMFLAIEPHVRAGVPNVAGGPGIEIIRLSPVFRNATFAPAAAARGLANLPPLPGPGGLVIPQFNENIPLRGQPAVINGVAGAMELQQFIDRSTWAAGLGDPTSYAPHLRKDPLPGVPAKSVIFLFAKGDQTVPNPTSSAILRAGDLTGRATFYRNDLAFAQNPATPRNPHTFLTNIAAPGLGPIVALLAQTQIATFFASDGRTVIDPDGAGALFETPLAAPPEELSFIP